MELTEKDKSLMKRTVFYRIDQVEKIIQRMESRTDLYIPVINEGLMEYKKEKNDLEQLMGKIVLQD